MEVVGSNLVLYTPVRLKPAPVAGGCKYGDSVARADEAFTQKRSAKVCGHHVLRTYSWGDLKRNAYKLSSRVLGELRKNIRSY